MQFVNHAVCLNYVHIEYGPVMRSSFSKFVFGMLFRI